MDTQLDTQAEFTELIRAATWPAHEAAEQSGFIRELMAGTLDRDAYAELVAQHHFIYSVIEDAAGTYDDGSVAGTFVFPELTRVPALERDLSFLLGSEWRDRVEATPATSAYCDRLREVCYSWPGGFVAHHYVRYMGDLSGGQYLRRVIERTYELVDHEGSEFYVFDEIEDTTVFKDDYRARLNAAPWDAEEQARITEEILVGYDHNTRLLDTLVSS